MKKRRGQKEKTEKIKMAVEMGKQPTWMVERVAFMKKNISLHKGHGLTVEVVNVNYRYVDLVRIVS